MPKYKSSQLVKMLRERKGLEREALLKIMAEYRVLDKTSLVRIEGDKLNPKPETLACFMKSINLPQEGFIYTKLDGQSMKTIMLCDYLEQLLEIGSAELAESVLTRLKATGGFNSGVYRQFICSKEARLYELLEKPSTEVMLLIEEGLAITYDNFDENCIDNIVLVFEEPELFHTMARLYAKDGDVTRTIKILSGMKASLARLPMTDREKEGQFAPVLLLLSECLMQTGDYEGALGACAFGAEYSAKFRQGRHNPDFELVRAKALSGLGRKEECLPHLQHAYFCSTLLGDLDKAKVVLESARDNFGIEFELYGADSIELYKQSRTPYFRGELIDCYSMGTLIKASRDKDGVSLEELCYGICDKSTLFRIENDELPGNIYVLEAIMQRQGRNLNTFKDSFLSKEDFVSIQFRDRIDELLIAQKYREADILLSELEPMRSFVKYNVNMQFIKTAKALIYASGFNTPPPEFPIMLMEALNLTYKGYTSRFIDRHPLTYNEIFIINAYAGYYKDIGEANRASEIYERLLRNLNENYMDEGAKARMFATVVLNYSSCLGMLGHREEALEAIDKGIIFDRKHHRLTMLPGLSYNKGYNLFMLGKEKESIVYFAMAYYCARMLATYDNAKAAGASIALRRVKDMFGITFS